MKIGIIDDMKHIGVIWEKGERKGLISDIRQNSNDCTKMKPENALTILRLWALWMIDDRVDLISEAERQNGWPVLGDEDEIFIMVFGGTHRPQQGQIFWELLNAITPQQSAS